jgi:hypothetical protein
MHDRDIFTSRRIETTREITIYRVACRKVNWWSRVLGQFNAILINDMEMRKSVIRLCVQQFLRKQCTTHMLA